MVVMVSCALVAINILPYQNTSASLMISIFLIKRWQRRYWQDNIHCSVWYVVTLCTVHKVFLINFLLNFYQKVIFKWDGDWRD